MTPRERMLAAMTVGAPEVPAAPLYLGLYLAPMRRRLRLQRYERLLDAAQRRPVSFDEEARLSLHVHRRGYEVFASPPDWCEAPLGPARASVNGAALLRRNGRLYWASPDGTLQDLGAQPAECIGAWWTPVRSVSDLPNQVPETRPEDIVEAGHTLLTRRIVESLGGEYCIVASVGTPFWGAYGLLGFTGLMEAIHDAPHHLLEAIARFVPYRLAHVKALRSAGVDVIFVESCLESADVLSPTQFRTFSLPYLRRLLNGIRELGLPCVLYFCGDPRDRLECLRELPCDALAFEESKKGFTVDIGEVRERIGDDKTLFGNVDVRLVRDGSPDVIRAEVQRQVRAAGAGGKFVVSVGSPLTLDTPPVKVDVLVEAAHAASP
ncbi:MAG: uroporphyrinogen decarboxylase family protein [Armatimonadota bacterium]